MSTPDEASERRARAAAGGFRDDGDGQDGLRRLLIGIGCVVLLGAVVAAAILFQSGGGSTAQHRLRLQVSRIAHGVAVGKPAAATHVVVYEDFGCPDCGTFEEASRDYLHADAASGRVYVEYRPVAFTGQAARRTADAFAGVLDTAGPRVALRFHDRLFDAQATGPLPSGAELTSLAVKAGARRSTAQQALSAPDQQWAYQADAAARAAGVHGLPTVLVDGRPMTAGSMTGLADRLETTIARKD